MAHPKLVEIVEVFSEEVSWPKMRVALEMLNALVGKGDNAFVKHKYATQVELKRFKENIEHPEMAWMQFMACPKAG